MTPPAVSEPVAEATPAPAPQPVVKSQPVESDNDVLPIAGAVGLGALALAGGAFALTRRKRRDEEFEAAPMGPMAGDDLLLTDTAPTFAVSSTAPSPVQVEGPATTLPAGFDLSRFGRHVQAAYRGPTADNPSLSLKNRLRRASFYDQRERMAAETAADRPAPRTEWVAPKQEPAVAARTTDHTVSRPGNWRQPGFKPAYQS